MPSDTLQKIADDGRALDALLDESEGDITGAEEIVDQFLAELKEREADKVDGYAWRIKALRADAEAAKRLADELLSKSRTLNGKADWLMGRMDAYLSEQGRDEVKGNIYSFKFARNGGKQPLVLETDDPMAFPEECRVTTVTVNKDAVRAAIEEGAPLEIPAHLGERGRSLRLR